MKKIFFIIIFLLLLSFSLPAQALEPVDVYLFHSQDCPHCQKELEFLDYLIQTDPLVRLHEFEVTQSQENRELFKKVGSELKASVSGVPFTVIGSQVIIGYSEQTTSKQLEREIKRCQEIGCEDKVGQIIAGQIVEVSDSQDQANQVLPETISLPIFGEIALKNFSLPLLTIMIGALDGFNPCAMWVLLFLISLLLGMENRTRMWILGTVFIIASAAVYFVFMAAWLNILLFIGFIVWVRLIIGLVALASGGYHLREYWKNKNGTCKVTGNERRQKIFARLKAITQNKTFFIALIGIILLAFAVNLVELICSAGLPAVYTQILTLSDLSHLSYYFYILLYIFVFMLDDLLVFIIAMATLRATGLGSKYSRVSSLIGGILMVIIGILLLFKPELLMFG